MAQIKWVAGQTVRKGQISQPFSSPEKYFQTFKLRTNQRDPEVLGGIPAKIMWNLFLGLLVYRSELCSFYPNTSFELFICYLNRFKWFSGKRLSLGVRSFAYLIIRHAFPAWCLFSMKPQMDGNNKCLFSSSWSQIVILS